MHVQKTTTERISIVGFKWITSVITSLATISPALVLLMLASCGGPAADSTSALPAGEWHTFEGSWTASGTRTTLNLEPDHTASNIHLKGAVVLTENDLGVGFRAEVIGLVDSQSGFVGRAVWTDEHGNEVFSELKGAWVGPGNYITGTFLGGTGRYAGCTGEYQFQWQYMLAPEDGSVSGRTVGFKGRARVSAPPASGPVG